MCVVEHAQQELGVKEVGVNSGPRVDQYLASVKLGGGFYWCAAFVHWNFRQCAEVLEPAREFAAAARFGQEHLVWRKGQKIHNRIAHKGDTFCLYVVSEKRIGHVGIIIDEDDDDFVTIEGNTNNGGSRNGDGVYKRRRAKNTVYCVNHWE